MLYKSESRREQFAFIEFVDTMVKNFIGQNGESNPLTILIPDGAICGLDKEV